LLKLQDGALTSSALFYAYCVIEAHAQINVKNYSLYTC